MLPCSATNLLEFRLVCLFLDSSSSAVRVVKKEGLQINLPVCFKHGNTTRIRNISTVCTSILNTNSRYISLQRGIYLVVYIRSSSHARYVYQARYIMTTWPHTICTYNSYCCTFVHTYEYISLHLRFDSVIFWSVVVVGERGRPCLLYTSDAADE